MDIEVLYWYWMVLGLILIVAEIFIPSFTILWFGIGAMLVGMTMLVVDISFTIQVLLWTLFSITSTILWFRSVKPYLSSLKKNSKDFESAIGEFGVVTKLPAGETYGKIRFSTPILDKDEWDFKCNDVIKLGDRLQTQEINKSYLLVSK